MCRSMELLGGPRLADRSEVEEDAISPHHQLEELIPGMPAHLLHNLLSKTHRIRAGHLHDIGGLGTGRFAWKGVNSVGK